LSSSVETQPPPSAHAVAAARRRVAEQLRAGHVKLAVVDDDSTGTQAVRGVPLIASWEEAELEWAMRNADPTFAVLTNSRALDERRAVAINREIGERLPAVARRLGVEVRVISRSDSTLRGHFPAEAEALAAGLRRAGQTTDCVLLCPAFPEAGRVTIDDVHWVRRGEQLVPVGETEYARDSVFGFTSSNLLDWVCERAGGQAQTGSVTLCDIRRGGPEGVARRLLQLRGQARYAIANAADPADLDVLAAGVTLAEQEGLRVVCRTGPSFLAARAGVGTAAPLTDEELAPRDPLADGAFAPRDPLADGALAPRGGRGLLVVGSHTALTTAQLELAQERHAFETAMLDVEALLSADARGRDAAVSEAAAKLSAALALGDAALVTSRRYMGAGDRARGLQVAAVVADALVEVVRAVARQVPLDWLLAKGGITSHDLATRALGARRAVVLGQLFPGQVSVWTLGSDSLRPGLRYVVFPGNVGDESALARTLDRLRGRA
jgi:uncharacterized protein YgbK (DUF1537 family)